jgi:hypothetical protein
VIEETIAQAAIRFEGKVYTLPRPARHADLFMANVNKSFGGVLVSGLAGGEQGFTTNTGRFVDRQEAVEIARKAGQISKKHGNDSMLFSEDVW